MGFLGIYNNPDWVEQARETRWDGIGWVKSVQAILLHTIWAIIRHYSQAYIYTGASEHVHHVVCARPSFESTWLFKVLLLLWSCYVQLWKNDRICWWNVLRLRGTFYTPRILEEYGLWYYYMPRLSAIACNQGLNIPLFSSNVQSAVA